MLVSNDSNGSAQEPSAGPPRYGPAEIPAQGQPPAPAWPAEPEQFAEPGSPAPGVWDTQAPVSGQPAHYDSPQQDWTPWTAQAGPAAEPAGRPWPQQQTVVGGMGPAWPRRIEPSPPTRGRFRNGLLVGLLVGLVVLAPAGYFVGDLLFGASKPAATGEPSPSSTALPPYEARQADLNRAKFDGDLAAMAEPWLPYLSRCVSNSDPGAPQPPGNEVTRVTCQLGDMTVFFVEFKSPEERDRELLTRKQQNLESQQLAPGAAAPTHKTGASGTNNGDYVEFAFRPPVAGAKTYAGIWWDRDGAPLVAARVEVPWVSGLNANWAPLRDVWQRRG